MSLPSSPEDAAFHVNRHGVLAIPGLFWLAIALLARQWVLLLLVAVTSLRSSGTDAALLLGDGRVPWGALAAQAPVLLLALAAVNRDPTAWAWARLLWRRGREIVALTALLNLGWTGKLLLESDYWTPWPELFLASCCLIDVAVVLALYTAPYYRQLFQEFPERPAAPTP